MKFRFLSVVVLASAVSIPGIAIAQTSLPNLVAQTTIGDLQRNNSVTLSGSVVRIQDDDFILDDGTGQILIEAESRPLRQANLKAGDTLTVTGRYDDDNDFDAISITLSSGEVIYIFDD